jgi:UTP-glucose-1-phosphate uridylyltransferase
VSLRIERLVIVSNNSSSEVLDSKYMQYEYVAILEENDKEETRRSIRDPHTHTTR